MTLQNKILPVALVAALLGGGVGAFVTRNPTTTTAPATTATQPSTSTTEATQPATAEQAKLDTATSADTAAFRDGFAEGYRAANGTSDSAVAPSRRSSIATPVVYRTASRRSRSVASNNSRRVYYDYNTQPRQRTFWQKHRDKLTVAMGTGGGAILGGLIGGRKGAAIGALAGGGGSALYTYKIRNRRRNY